MIAGEEVSVTPLGETGVFVGVGVGVFVWDNVFVGVTFDCGDCGGGIIGVGTFSGEVNTLRVLSLLLPKKDINSYHYYHYCNFKILIKCLKGH